MSLDFSDQDAPASTTPSTEPPAQPASFGLLFQAPDLETRVPARPARSEQDDREPAEEPAARSRSGRGGRQTTDEGRADDQQSNEDGSSDNQDDASEGGRRRRGGRGRRAKDGDATTDDSRSEDGKDEDSRGGRGKAPGDGKGGRGKAAGDGKAASDSKGGRGKAASDGKADDRKQGEAAGDADNGPAGPEDSSDDEDQQGGSTRRRRRRRRSGSGASEGEDPPGTVTKVREGRKKGDEVTAIRGSTRLEAKKQRRREGREAGRRRTVITEAEFLARRESVERAMVVREREGRTQIGVLEDGVLVEHYVAQDNQQSSMAGNVYLGRVQNVLPSMEAAFVDIGRGRNAVLYAGEVNWDAAGLEGNQPRRIENALKAGESVLVQVTKDPMGHKGARLTSQISLPGRYLVYVPGNSMTGISRKLPDTERSRLKKILKEVLPENAGVIVRTAAEGASEEELRADVERLTKAWERIQKKAASSSTSAPALLQGESELTVRVVRDVFNEDFSKLVVAGDNAWKQISDYLESVAPDLAERAEKWTGEKDIFTVHRIDEQLAKAMDRKVWLPSGGSLIIDRTEAMTVIDVNTGKFIGSGGNLEETVTKNNIEAAEEIVRQLRVRDIGGIIVVDFIDMVLESNRDLVVRRLLECLGRDRTKHQVAEVTSLGLVQMTRKRVGTGLVEIFSEPCEHCGGRGIIVHDQPVEKSGSGGSGGSGGGGGGGKGRKSRKGGGSSDSSSSQPEQKAPERVDSNGRTPAQIAAAAHAAAVSASDKSEDTGADAGGAGEANLAEPSREQGQPAIAGSSEPEATPPVEPEASLPQPEPEPPRRTRRKRARVVAAAGAPGEVTAEPVATDAPSETEAPTVSLEKEPEGR